MSTPRTLLVERPDLGSIVATGSDRASWLHGIVTCDVEGLPEGEGRWGLALTKPGKILTDLVVLPAGDVLHVVAPKGRLGALADHLGRFLVMEDVDLSAPSTELAWLELHGPGARESAFDLARRFQGPAGGVDFSARGDAVAAVPVARLTEAVASIGQGVRVASEEDFRRFRVEELVPLHGVDMGAEDNPHEASLDRRCVSWTKGCYLGQEAVCMQDMRGRVKRRLVIVALDGGAAPAPGSPVTAASGATAGESRSATASSRFGGPAVLARVAAEFSEPGTELAVAGNPGRVVAPSVAPG